MSVVDEAGRLAIVHRLCHSVVEEGIIDIQLVDHLIHREGEREDSPNGGRFHLIVHSQVLSEASMDPTCLVTIQAAINFELVAEDSLPDDHIGTNGTWHQVSGVVGQQPHIPPP